MVISCPPRSADAHPLLAMADWLHCNLCFAQPGDGTPFHITSCGHIYCEKCVEKGSKDGCKMCGSKCSRLELSGKIKPDIETFFLDPIELLNKAFKKFMQTWEFQRNHRRRLFSYLSGKVMEQNKILTEAKKMMTSAQALEREVIKLREENVYLKKLLHEKGIGSSSNRPSPRTGCSPTGYRSSPSKSPMRFSPYGGSSTRPGSGFLLPHATSQASQVTSGITPGRLLARTPPIEGRMGTVGISPIMMHKTPQSVNHQIYTPNFHGTP